MSLGILNPPIASNITHNGCESSLEQLSGSESLLGHSGLFYESDGTTEKQVDYADFAAWVSGVDETWLGMTADSNGVCVVTDSAIYTNGHEYSVGNYNDIVGAIPNDCGAGQMEVLKDVNGQNITDGNGYPILTLP